MVLTYDAEIPKCQISLQAQEWRQGTAEARIFQCYRWVADRSSNHTAYGRRRGTRASWSLRWVEWPVACCQCHPGMLSVVLYCTASDG